jgi:hypothetical protein
MTFHLGWIYFSPQSYARGLELKEYLARLLVIDLAGEQPLYDLPQCPLH